MAWFRHRDHDAADNPAPVPGSGPVNETDLVGTWENLLFMVDVRADGTLSVTPTNQRTQPGRWRLDSEGGLHILPDGSSQADEMVTKVAVSGPCLSIDFLGHPMILDRVD